MNPGRADSSIDSLEVRGILLEKYRYQTIGQGQQNEIFFGPGSRNVVGELIRDKKVLGLASRRGIRQFQSDEVLGSVRSELTWFSEVSSNPDLTSIALAYEKYKNSEFDFVLAFGGGSAIDFAKVLALGLRIKDWEMIAEKSSGSFGDVVGPSDLRVLAIPTTSGSGAEVTPFAAVWDHVQKKKASLASSRMAPDYVVVDPELTRSLDFDSTLYPALDAFNQAFESIWNKNSTSTSIQNAANSIQIGLEALTRLDVDFNTNTTRAELAEASLLAGLAISETRTSICHAFSYPLTLHFGVPHGLACAFSMSAVFEQCRVRAPQMFDQLLNLTNVGEVGDYSHRITTLLSTLQVGERIRSFVGPLEDLWVLLGREANAERLGNFPLRLSENDLRTLVNNSYLQP